MFCAINMGPKKTSTKPKGSGKTKSDKSDKTKGKSSKDKDKSKKGNKSKDSLKEEAPPKPSVGDKLKAIKWKDIRRLVGTYMCCCFTGRKKPKKYWQPFVREGKRKLDEQDAYDPTVLEQMRLAEEEKRRNMMIERIRNKAALVIQTNYRYHYASVLAKRKWFEAMEATRLYWERYWHLRWLAKQDGLMRQDAISGVIGGFVGRSIAEGGLMFALKSGASTVIQKMFRGYLIRRLDILNRPTKKWKKRVVPSRFSIDVYRRIWGRSVYEPQGGWPGRHDHIEYDMWKFIEKPPKGRQFGLRTRKVIAVPRSNKEKQLLMHDPNAWVGVPITWDEDEQGVVDARNTAEALAGSSQDGADRAIRIMDGIRTKFSKTEDMLEEQVRSTETPVKSPKPSVYDNLLMTSPYKDPVVPPPGYIPLNPEELVASFKSGNSGVGRDKALAEMLKKPTAAVYDAEWLERSVKDQDKRIKAEKAMAKRIAAENKAKAVYNDAMLTYRGVINEITGNYSVTSGMTDESALSHLLHTVEPWKEYDASYRKERNYGQVVTDKRGKRPLVQATPIRGTRKPLTERHKLSMEIERARTEAIKAKRVLDKMSRIMDQENTIGGLTEEVEDELSDDEINLDAPPALDPHSILLGKYAHNNHRMSKQSRKIIEHSRWSLMQHRYHHAQQAEINRKRNSMTQHGDDNLRTNRAAGTGTNTDDKTVGVSTLGISDHGFVNDIGGSASPVSRGVSRFPAQKPRSVTGSPTPVVTGGLVKGGAMDDDVYNDDSTLKKSPGKSHRKQASPNRVADGMSQITYLGTNAPGSSWTEIDTHRNSQSGRGDAVNPSSQLPNDAQKEEDDKMEAIMGYWSSSPWGMLKEQLAEEISQGVEPILPFEGDEGLKKRTLYKPKKEIVSKARVWPVKPRRHYKLRYSWLPQPMVNRAAIMVYDPPAGMTDPILPVIEEAPVYVNDNVVSDASSVPISQVTSVVKSIEDNTNIEDEDLTQITNNYSYYNQDVREVAETEDPSQYIHNEVGGQRWTSIASQSKPIGKVHPIPQKSTDHAKESPVNSTGGPRAARNKALKKKYSYIDVSSDEDDDTNINGRSRRNVTKQSSVGHDDDKSYSTLPTASQFSFRSSSSPGRSRSVQKTHVLSKRQAGSKMSNESYWSDASPDIQENTSHIFNPQYYDGMGHVKLGSKKFTRPIKVKSPEAEEIHPYSWL